jgi:Hydrogenase/urease nickel incorporation, metallochaperone, hypA
MIVCASSTLIVWTMKPRSTSTYSPTLTAGVTSVETLVCCPSASSTSASDSRTAITREGRIWHTGYCRQHTLSESNRVHELALARSLVDQILEVVQRERLRRVSRVVLELGTAAGIDADALRFGFEVATQRTTVQGAALEIAAVPDGRDLQVKVIDGV